RVTGVRGDGFHLIDAEMVSLDLHDVLTITPGGNGIGVTGPFAGGVPTDQSNLVSRAMVMLDANEAHVEIDKQIPHGGGLGGGSTDAATVMRWAGMGTSDSDLARASHLGADIAFCLVGGRARVTGIGEIVEPLPYLDLTVTLVIPPLVVSTPAVYRAWDERTNQSTDGPNDLEPAALAAEPRLQYWREAIGNRVSCKPTLAGSGATWFVDGEHQDALGDLLDEGATVVVARTVPIEVAAPTE
ncbi:MAG: 4-(cytidine 5'-diphospho)-2-C-methyl-D-erythritol kinase, partial [Actinobacteria bacterium]